MAIKNIYKSTFPSINFVTSKGATLVFSEGRYVTDNEREIVELEWEVKNRHPHIYVDANEAQVDTEVVEALAAAHKRATDEVLAAHAAKTGTQVSADGTVLGQAAAAQTIGSQQLASAVTGLPTIRSAVGTVGIAGSSITGATAQSVSK